MFFSLDLKISKPFVMNLEISFLGVSHVQLLIFLNYLTLCFELFSNSFIISPLSQIFLNPKLNIEHGYTPPPPRHTSNKKKMKKRGGKATHLATSPHKYVKGVEPGTTEKQSQQLVRREFKPGTPDCKVDKDADHLDICLPNHVGHVLHMNALMLIYKFGFCFN